MVDEVGGLKPGRSLSFICFQISRKNVSLRKGAAKKRVEGGSGESKKKDRQAFQE